MNPYVQLKPLFQSLKSKCVELETAARSSVVHTESVSSVGSAPSVSRSSSQSSEKTVIHGSTVVTRVEERSTFDVSRLVADLDARDAELTVLRAVLSQKENQLQVRMAGSNMLSIYQLTNGALYFSYATEYYFCCGCNFLCQL